MTKDDFLSANQLTHETVEIDGLGTVVVRELCAFDAVKFKDELKESERLAKLIIACIYWADGTSVFTDDDLPMLQTLKSDPLYALSKPVMRVNSWIKELDAETAEDVKKKSDQLSIAS